MTNNELNQYIKQYIEKDKTHRAIMLTGDWGKGKSYYIKNSLIPFLHAYEHKCIVVSLYGFSDPAEISKAIYIEVKLSKVKPDSQVGNIAYIGAKTVLKNVANHFGIELSLEEKDLQQLYQSVDLTGMLIVFEDVERSDIGILQLLGYVNNLVEQDNVKVMLVTNEKEFVHYRPSIKKKDGHLYDAEKYTDETLRYLQIKEKTIGDTIVFTGDLKRAVHDIINLFDNETLKALADDQCVEDIVKIMLDRDTENLRSIIYACQKTANIFERIQNIEDYSEDFLKTILFGTVSLSLRLNAGENIEWNETGEFSTRLGSLRYPLFRFCYDYVLYQSLEDARLQNAQRALEEFRRYDKNKSVSDPDLQILYNWSSFPELTNRECIERITDRLQNQDAFAFQEYGKMAYCLIVLEHLLDVDVSRAKELMVNNLRNKTERLNRDYIFWNLGTDGEEQAVIDEYNEFRSRLIEAWNTETGTVFDFTYEPADTAKFYASVCEKKEMLYTDGAFASRLNNDRIIAMLKESTPRQMLDLRNAYAEVYSGSNVGRYLYVDKEAVQDLKAKLSALLDYEPFDRIQKKQIGWFIRDLDETLGKL